MVNPQTALLCSILNLTDPNAVHLGISNHENVARLLADSGDVADMPEDDDDSDDDDDQPSDINSSLDTSYLSSSLDMSDSFSHPGRMKLTNKFSPSCSTTPEVDDDDEEFRAILAAQRQSGKPSYVASGPNDKPAARKRMQSLGAEAKASTSFSPESESSEEEFESVAASQRQAFKVVVSNYENTRKLAGDAASSPSKSSSDLESTSQDSADELDRARGQAGGGQKSVAGCSEENTGEKSPVVGNGFSSPSIKRCSPDAATTPSPSPSTGKKLKRRNMAMYSSSGTEEDAY